MCTTCTIPSGLDTLGAPPDPGAGTFADRLLEHMNGAAICLMLSVGHRTGLLDALRENADVTSAELAGKAKLSERYVREWLGAMTTGGIVALDPQTGRYSLPAEHAAWLTRAASPNNLASVMQFISVLGGVETKVVEAFAHGRGVPYSAYERFHEVMAEESGQTVVAALDEHILPLIGDVIPRLEQGVDVLDVGCGSGRALLHLAQRFPNSRFVGYDFSEEAIAAGNQEAAKRGLANARFEVRDVARMGASEAFDLIFAFDAIHDQARPDLVLRNIQGALRRGGVFLMQDIQGTSSHHGDIGHPAAPFIYTISCMHCMSVSLASGGMGLGAAWGKALALRMLDDAGFENVNVETLEHDFMNFWYVARK